MPVKTIKIRLKDRSATIYLNDAARAVNFVWNYCNEISHFAIRNRSKWLSGFDLNKLTAGSSSDLQIPSASIQLVCQEYAKRRQQFKKAKLRWRGKRSLGWIPFKTASIKFKDGMIYFNKKILTCFQPERLPDGKFKQGEFCQDALGNWYLCVAVEYEPRIPLATREVGIDLGVKAVATLSSGEKISNSKHYRSLERSLGLAQKDNKKRRIRKIHAKIKNRRIDELHKASTDIVKKHKLIVIGDLKVKNLAKTKMAKSLLDAATSVFKAMLKYKASALQRRYIEVPENFSSQICSSCETIPESAPKGVKDLGLREWVCSNCNSIHDRDVNAALNILRFGHESLALK